LVKKHRGGADDPARVNDAYFPQGGIAKLAPGDYVINRSALGGPSSPMGRGAMLNTALAREGGATAAPGNVNFVVNINGGDTSKIQKLIIDQIRYIERRRMKGQAV
jgi:hypothetical protein